MTAKTTVTGYPRRHRRRIGYAIYTSDVKAEDKYKVTHLPRRIFKTRKAAKATLIREGLSQKDFKILKVEL
jgi:hypothetical protein